jgi:hypothetical protein
VRRGSHRVTTEQAPGQLLRSGILQPSEADVPSCARANAVESLHPATLDARLD